MDFITLLLCNAAGILGWMLLFWLISIPLRNVSIADIAWGLGFVLVAWVSAWMDGKQGINSWLLPILTTLWGVRLSGYIAWRNHAKPEDKRYQAMRTHRGPAFVYSSLWIVFGLQGVLIFFISLPVQLGVHHANHEWTPWHVLGIALWLVGFLFETIGDWQLARFKAQPKNQGRVMDQGLWRYTRHPNYFGDFLVWWGLFCISLSVGFTTALWTILSPLLMSYLLLNVSGVPMLEKSMNRPGYQDYLRRTNAFFPWFPKAG